MSAAFAVALIAALAYLPIAPRPPSLARSVVKTLAVAALAIGALGAPPMLAPALALCAVGDWLLSRDGETAFMAGVAAFAAGHLAYVVLFLGHPASEPARLVAAPGIWIAAALLVTGLAAAAALWPRAGALRGPVLGYVPVILAMGLSALTLPGQGALAWIVPAAMAFVMSDLILAAEKFLLPPGHSALRVTPYAVWVLYWCAQAGFLVAFA